MRAGAGRILQQRIGDTKAYGDMQILTAGANALNANLTPIPRMSTASAAI